MGIGTSMGAFYDDAFHAAAAQWDPKYDENTTPDQNVQSDQWTQQSRTSQANTPIPVADTDSGKYVGDIKSDAPEYKDWGSSWSDAIGKGGLKGMTPEEYMKTRGPDEEGATFGSPDLLFIRKKTQPNKGDSIPMSSNIDPSLIHQVADKTPSPDYDMDAWQKATGLTSLPEGQHYPDTYKLPNHITFSDESVYHGVDGNEGGHWDKIEGDPDHDWKFTPGKTNLDNHTPEELKDYFNKVEPRSKLILPDGHQSSNIDPSLIHQVADKSDGDIHTIGPGPEYNKWDEALQEHGAIRIPKELDEPQKWLNQDHFKDFLKNIDREDKPDGSVILRLKKPTSIPMS